MILENSNESNHASLRETPVSRYVALNTPMIVCVNKDIISEISSLDRVPRLQILDRHKCQKLIFKNPRLDNKLKYNKLGKSGIEVSEVGFGAWTISSKLVGKKIEEDEAKTNAQKSI